MAKFLKNKNYPEFSLGNLESSKIIPIFANDKTKY